MFRQYKGIIRNGLASILTYREHFITTGISFLVYYVVLYYLWNAVYAGSGGTINGVTFSSAFVTLSLTGCLLQCMNGGIEWDMCFDMIQGDIIIKLVRPTDYMLYMYSEKWGLALSSIFLFAIPVFVITGFLFPGELYLGWNIIPFLVSLFISFGMMFLLEFMVGLLTFSTQSVWGLSTLKELIVGFFAGTTVPIAFFPKGLLAVTNVLPFKSMYYDPVRMLMDRELGFDGCMRIIGFELVWFLVLLVLARLLYRVMSRRIVVNGG